MTGRLDLAPAAPKLTEADVLALLRKRHESSGNGGSGEHAFLVQVRNGAGFASNRTFDAVAVNLWPSRGLEIHVYEVKVSRSDWRRELAKPEKAEDAWRVADRFTIVAPAGVVREGELPSTWGLIEVLGDGTDEKPWKLRTEAAAPLIGEGPTAKRAVGRDFLVGLLRACPDAIPGGGRPAPSEAEIVALRAAAYAEGVAAERSNSGYEDEAKRLREVVRAFEAASGVCLTAYRTDVASIGAAVRAVLAGDAEADRATKRITDARAALLDAAERLRPLVEGA